MFGSNIYDLIKYPCSHTVFLRFCNIEIYITFVENFTVYEHGIEILHK